MGVAMETSESAPSPDEPDAPEQPDQREQPEEPDQPDQPAASTGPPSPDAFDSPWKDAIEQAFPEFLAFYFPAVHSAIDWKRGHTFLDKELRSILRKADAGMRYADKLVRVHRKGGGEDWVYVHIEIQASRKTDFERRMFIYSYRLFERFGRPVASLAVLADSHRHWRPDGYGFELFGCRHWLTFPIVKLLDYEPDLDALLADPNPFALLTAAHLMTRRTRGRPRQRMAAKWRLIRLLYERNWSRERVIGFFKVLDWMMTLPDTLADRLWQDIEQYEGRQNMAYITTVEQIGIRKGMQKGMQEGMQRGMQQGMQRGIEKGRAQILLDQLTHRFGLLPKATVARIESGPSTDIDRWARRILEAGTLEEVFADDESAGDGA